MVMDRSRKVSVQSQPARIESVDSDLLALLVITVEGPKQTNVGKLT